MYLLSTQRPLIVKENGGENYDVMSVVKGKENCRRTIEFEGVKDISTFPQKGNFAASRMLGFPQF